MLSIVLLWISIYLTGMLLCKTGGEKETSQLWIHLTGFFFLFFSQGVVFTVAQFLEFSFSQACNFLLLWLAVVSLAAVPICRKELAVLPTRVKSRLIKGKGEPLYPVLAAWLLLGIFLVMCKGMVGNRQDALLETMQTSLVTDTINQVHPFTGQIMEQGVILSKRLLTLPFWYGGLQIWTGFSPQNTVWVWGSFFTIIFSLMAAAELVSLLFEGDSRKTGLFVCLMELLILSGDYIHSSAGYQLLFYGYSGEIIVGAVALPMLLCLLYRFFLPFLYPRDREGRKKQLGLWSVVFKLGMVVGSSLFLAPLLTGPVLLLTALVISLICFGGIYLVKKTWGST